MKIAVFESAIVNLENFESVCLYNDFKLKIYFNNSQTAFECPFFTEKEAKDKLEEILNILRYK